MNIVHWVVFVHIHFWHTPGILHNSNVWDCQARWSMIFLSTWMTQNSWWSMVNRPMIQNHLKAYIINLSPITSNNTVLSMAWSCPNLKVKAMQHSPQVVKPIMMWNPNQWRPSWFSMKNQQSKLDLQPWNPSTLSGCSIMWITCCFLYVFLLTLSFSNYGLKWLFGLHQPWYFLIPACSKILEKST